MNQFSKIMTTFFPPPFSIDFYLMFVASGLFAVIVYFVFFFKKDFPNAPKVPDEKPLKTPDVMGRSQPAQRQTLPNTATRRQTEEPAEKPVTFAREIPSEELDQVFGGDEYEGEYPDPDSDEDEVDWQDEETELQAYRTAENNDFATGVAFHELNATADLLQKPELQADEQKIVIDVATRLQQTDLWEKFTNAIPQANQKIAKMLDTSHHRTTELPPDDWQSFDIRNFI